MELYRPNVSYDLENFLEVLRKKSKIFRQNNNIWPRLIYPRPDELLTCLDNASYKFQNLLLSVRNHTVVMLCS